MDLVVKVRVMEDRGPEGRLEDVLVGAGRSRLRVAFDREQPRLAVGGPVRLELASALFVDPLRTRALVASRFQEEHAEVYEFELSVGTGAPGAASLERVSSLRVRPEGELAVELRLPGRILVGELDELTAEGAGVLVSLDSERELGRTTSLRLVFTLPGEEGQFDPLGELRSRRVQGAGVRLEFDFLPPTGERQAALRHQLRGHVLARQAELLRGLLGSGQP